MIFTQPLVGYGYFLELPNAFHDAAASGKGVSKNA